MTEMVRTVQSVNSTCATRSVAEAEATYLVALGKESQGCTLRWFEAFETRLPRGIADGDIRRGVHVQAIARSFWTSAEMSVQARDGASTHTLKALFPLHLCLFNLRNRTTSVLLVC
jgi:hypothetical protein